MKRIILTLAILAALSSCSKEELAEVDTTTSKVENQSKTYLKISNVASSARQMVSGRRRDLGLPHLGVDQNLTPFVDAHTTYMIDNQRLSHDNWESRKADILAATGATDAAESIHYERDGSGYVAGRTWIATPEDRVHIDNPDFNHAVITAMQDPVEGYWFTIIYISK